MKLINKLRYWWLLKHRKVPLTDAELMEYAEEYPAIVAQILLGRIVREAFDQSRK